MDTLTNPSHDSSKVCPSLSQTFKTHELDDLLAERLDEAFHNETSNLCLEKLAEIAEKHSPIDLAYAVSRLPSALRPLLFENFSTLERKVQFIIHTDSTTRASIFRYITVLDTISLFNLAPTDEVVDMLDDLSERRFRRVLDKLDPLRAEKIRELKKHSRESAGRLLTHEYFAFAPEQTVHEVAECIKNNPGIQFTGCFYIVDPQGILLGHVSARSLIVNKGELQLHQIMRPVCHFVYPDCSREEVIDIMNRYQLSGLPVVSEGRVLLGVITSEDTLEVLEDIADETIANMAGTTEKYSEPESAFKKFLHRAPWLFVTLFAGLLNMSVMNMFQQIDGLVLTFVFFFVPLVTGLSGNIGLQCSTVLVRNIALGLFSSQNFKKVMVKEAFLGFGTGAFFGVVSGIFVFLLNFFSITAMAHNPFVVGLVVGLGLMGACLCGTLLGVFSPIIFYRSGIDPAVASGPIVTAFNDFLSMSIYFLIALLVSFFLF